VSRVSGEQIRLLYLQRRGPSSMPPAPNLWPAPATVARGASAAEGFTPLAARAARPDGVALHPSAATGRGAWSFLPSLPAAVPSASGAPRRSRALPLASVPPAALRAIGAFCTAQASMLAPTNEPYTGGAHGWHVGLSAVPYVPLVPYVPFVLYVPFRHAVRASHMKMSGGGRVAGSGLSSKPSYTQVLCT